MATTTARRKEYAGTNKLTGIKDAHNEIEKLKELTVKQANVAATQSNLLREFNTSLRDMELSLRALQTLTGPGVSDDELASARKCILISDFDSSSKMMDEANGFETCGAIPPEKKYADHDAIVNLRFFNGAVENKEREIIRARIDLDSPDKFTFLVPSLVGMTVGEAKTIEEGGIKMVTLLVGARKKITKEAQTT